ncbi:hypothetical protein DQ238_03475 [Geodermatophilus sp. TF02-6]|uniref:hypothetical protein n=1 Tax=Geodermatophilus sp. TF02-6 TaxID=2250575 RepID=UPI000DEAAE96|nr:hypothetical protein [Geodermatophilus sp. TF02-6]RBY82372.1 hypothetical protein DQ238_03475 [Geodermatophilus sp. TF02-6]
MSPRERVVVSQEDDGSWRWRYVGTDTDGKPVQLPGNDPEDSCEEAVAAARVAYPGLPVQVDAPPNERGPAAEARPRGLRPALLVLLLGGVSAARHRWGGAAAAAVLAGLLAARGARRRRHRR